MSRLIAIRELLIRILYMAYDAETALCGKLPEIKEYVLGNELKTLFDDELKKKRTQKVRLEAAFAVLREPIAEEPDEMVKELNSLQLKLAQTHGLSTFTDHTIIRLKTILTIHLIKVYQAAISCCSALGYMEVTRILRRALLSERQTGRKLKTLEKLNQLTLSVKAIHE